MLLKRFAPLNVGHNANIDSAMRYCMTNHFCALVNDNTVW